MRLFLMSASAVAIAMSGGTAHAQQSDADATQASTTDPVDAADAEAQEGNLIVVTAERRNTSLQRAPVAATVLTGEDLVRKSVDSVEQLQFASPSLTVNTTGQGNAFNIRGIGKTEQSSAIGVGVVTYRDGVATFPGYFQREPFYDIASVEVLRGPQGTFAGSNATGGAVFVTQQDPIIGSFGGYGLAEYGNYDKVKLQGALNVPAGDTFAMRFAGNFQSRDTFYNVSGPWTGNPGDQEYVSGRASFLWEPSANFNAVLKADYNNIEYGGLPAGRATDTGDPLDVANNAPLAGRDEFGRVVLRANYRFDSGLELRSITGFQRGTTTISNDADGTAAEGTPTAPAINFRADITEEIWSQEINLISPDNQPFTWLIGAYYQDDRITIPANGGFVQDATPNSLAPLVFDTVIQGTNPKTALAGFGQIAYEFANGLEIQAGARLSRTTSANDALAMAFIPPLPDPILTLPQVDKTEDDRLNGKLALNWTIDRNNFVYAFVATGAKQGGLNGPNFAGLQPRAFEAEDVVDYEIGYKGTFFGGRLRTQIGGYYTEYENFQISIVDPDAPSISSIFNVAGTSKLYGVELSAQGNFSGFEFDLATALSNSELGTFFAIDPRLGTGAALTCGPVDGPASARCIDLTGREQPYAPDFTLSAGVQYAIPIGADVSLTPRVDFSHIASTFGTLFQNEALGDRLEARDILNAQLTLVAGDWSISAFGTNLLDQHYVAAINGARRLAGAPRQYGIRVSRSF